MQSPSTIHAGFLLLCITVVMLALIGRVAYLQTSAREQALARAARQHHLNQTLPARRGTIFDATGNVLAGTIQTQTLFVDPFFLHQRFQQPGRSLGDMDLAIEQLARIIGQDDFELSQLLGSQHHRRFVVIAENLDDATAQAIRELRIPGVGLQPTNVRYYPMGSLAAHLLGGSRKDGPGLDGLEFHFDELLSGQDGRKRSLRDARRRAINVAANDYRPPVHGQHLILTIHANIQLIAEQELAAVCREHKADRGEVVVMDPRTGDVLAIANWPAFNPQNIEDSTADRRRNRAITDPVELGSVIKPFIVAPALAADVTRVDEVFSINGPLHVTEYRRRIRDVSTYHKLALWDILVKSSNIGMALLAERLGNPKLHRALVEFGFGQRTGIELPGESPGLVRPLHQWTRHSTESVAMGYELMVTPLQLARAFCAFANGGRLVTPRLVQGVLDPDGNIVQYHPAQADLVLPQAIDPITAAEVKRILADVPIRGTGQRARSNTWNIFGKTGTAHISAAGRYDQSRYTASFIGAAPAESPRLVVAIVVHEPDRGIAYYGGTVAAPAAGRILERSLAYLQVSASPDLPLPPPHIQNVLDRFNPNQYRNSPPPP